MEAIYRTAALLMVLTYTILPTPASGAQCLIGEYWDDPQCFLMLGRLLLPGR